MIDIHCHILPGTDDGPDTIEEAIEMAKIARENGIQTIIATPHYIDGEGYKNSILNQETLNRFRKELLTREIEVKVYLGNEINITPNIMALLEAQEVVTLNQSRYVLIEFPSFSLPMFIEELIFRLTLKGIVPIIAHPDRNANIIEDPNILYRLINRGCLVQLDFGGIQGKFGDPVRNTAKILLEHNMVHFISTDGHSPKDMILPFKKRKLLSKLLGENKLDDMINLNPSAVVGNSIIKVPEPKQYSSKNRVKFLRNIL